MWEIFVPVVIRAVQENVTIVKQLCEYRVCKWSQPPNPNRRPTDYKSVALPTELSRHLHRDGRRISYYFRVFQQEKHRQRNLNRLAHAKWCPLCPILCQLDVRYRLITQLYRSE